MMIDIKTSVIFLILAIMSVETYATPIDEPIPGSNSDPQELARKIKRESSPIELEIMELIQSAGGSSSLALESGALHETIQILHELHKRSPKQHKMSLLTRLADVGKKLMKSLERGMASS